MFSNTLPFQVQNKDYEKVINCLSTHIPKIFDESLPPENEIVFMKTKGKHIFNLPSLNIVSSAGKTSQESTTSSYTNNNSFTNANSEPLRKSPSSSKHIPCEQDMTRCYSLMFIRLLLKTKNKKVKSNYL